MASHLGMALLRAKTDSNRSSSADSSRPSYIAICTQALFVGRQVSGTGPEGLYTMMKQPHQQLPLADSCVHGSDPCTDLRCAARLRLLL